MDSYSESARAGRYATLCYSKRSMVGGYHVVGSVGSGGMGSVSLALRGLDVVAIKRMHPQHADDPEHVNRFLDEAQIAARVRHPNVTRIFAIDRVFGELVIVMEYVEGVSLAQLFKSARDRGARLAQHVVRRIVHDALMGLHAAHELVDEAGVSLGVVHRDVSPQNLLVGVDGITRVTDFGIAFARNRLAPTRNARFIKGKLNYLSPEQVRRLPVDRRADVFTTGVVLWESLTARGLFATKADGGTLTAILKEPIAPPSALVPELPLELDEVVLCALERDPARRYPTALAFATALAAAPGGMASREEVGALVRDLAAATLAHRRKMMHAARIAQADAAAELAAAEASTTPRRALTQWRTAFAAAKKNASEAPPRLFARGRRDAYFAAIVLLLGALTGIFVAKMAFARKAPPVAPITRPAPALLPSSG